MEKYPRNAFITAIALVGLQFAMNLIPNSYERIPGTHEGGLFGDGHGVQDIGNKRMTGGGLRPSDMATERLTHDKPRRTSMQFV
jgi:hypothetical protein